MATLNQAFVLITQKLAALYEDRVTREQHAWWILEAATQLKRIQLMLDPERVIAPEVMQSVDALVHGHLYDYQPLAYGIGSVPFCGLTIKVEPPILIPRMETEEWVMNLIEQIKKLPEQPLAILDLCTGSGCVGLALASAFHYAQVTAVDINPNALVLAKKNAAIAGIENISFVLSDLFEKLPTQAFDLVVTNPPYISSLEYEALDLSVRRWEDPLALHADDNGQSIIKRIIAHAHQYVRHHDTLTASSIPTLIVEIGTTQGNAVKQLMLSAGYRAVTIDKDMAGHDRVVSGRFEHAYD